jgi:hypothetical protein
VGYVEGRASPLNTGMPEERLDLILRTLAAFASVRESCFKDAIFE